MPTEKHYCTACKHHFWAKRITSAAHEDAATGTPISFVVCPYCHAAVDIKPRAPEEHMEEIHHAETRKKDAH